MRSGKNKINKINGKHLLFIFIIMYAGIHCKAQECSYSNHSAILVDVIDTRTKEPIHGLNMYLIFEYGKAIEEVNTQEADNPKERMPCYDNYLFWENNSKTIPKQCGHLNSLYRQNFPNAGNHYISVVPSYSGLIDMSQFAKGGCVTQRMPWSMPIAIDELQKAFFINLKIEDRDGKKNGGVYASQQIRIPIAAVLDICKNNLAGSNGNSLHDELLNTIKVELKANDTNYKATIQHNKFDSYLFPYYEMFPAINSPADDELLLPKLSLQKIELYNEQTATLLQTIMPPENANVIWAIGQIELGNFYNEPNINKLGFRVPAQPIAGRETAKDCYYYYKFNRLTKLYEPDTLLNNKQETVYNKNTKRMQACQRQEIKDANLVLHYELKNKDWLLVQADTYYKPKPAESSPPPKITKCYIDAPFKTKRVQYFDTGNTKCVIDTFWISNYGNKKATLTVTSNAYLGGNFYVPKEILPNQKLPIVYKRDFIGWNIQNNNIKEVHGFWELINEGINIEYDDGQTVTASINYIILSHLAVKTTMPDASLHFAIKKSDDVYKIVNTFSSGFLKEYGEYYLPDACKIGEWTIVDSNEKYIVKKEQHSKLFSVKTNNVPLQNCRITLVSKWKAIEIPIAQNHRFAISKDVYLIMVSFANARETRGADYTIDFDKLQQEDGVTLNLLGYNEPFYYHGQIKIPLDVNHQQYKPIFDLQFAANKMKQNTNTFIKDDWQVFYFSALQKDYPNLLYYNIDTFYNDYIKQRHSNPIYVLDFSKCTAKETAKIFSAIEKDSNIKTLTLLQHANAQSFCDNTVYIIDAQKQVLDSAFLNTAKSLGFTYQNMQTGMNYYQHYFRYQSKIVNTDFYKTFNQLCKANHLGQINLNVYGYARLESKDE